MDDSDDLLKSFAAAPNTIHAVAPPAPAPSAEVIPLQRIRYTHDAMIDLIIARPEVSQNEIAATFGYTAASISRIVNSDAFQARLHERRKELIDPGILQNIDEQFRDLAAKSLRVVTEKLEATKSVDVAFKGLEIASKALGFGARNAGVQVNNSFVVHLPEKAASQEAWIAKYGRSAGGGQVQVAEAVELPEKEA